MTLESDTIEGSLYRYLADHAEVAAIIGTGGSPAEARLYFGHAAEKAPTPYAVFFRVGGEATAELTRSSIANSRFQFDAYDKTATGAKALATALNHALDGLAAVLAIGRVTAQRISVMDLPEPAPKLYRRTQDYSVWHPEN